MRIISAAFIAAALLAGGTAFAGSLEPGGAPAPTMKTLDQIPPTWSQLLPGAQRFELVLGGEAVLDKETGLVWDAKPQVTPLLWQDAQLYCTTKELHFRKGWRLPAIEELASLVDTSFSGSPKLTSGHPFQNIISHYWSSSAADTDAVWTVDFSSGAVEEIPHLEISPALTWCVRGGK